MAYSAYSIGLANWRNRSLTVDLVRRDIRLRYLGSLLGKFWNILSPLAMILIYTFVFSIVMGARLGGVAENNRFAFVIYLCAGLLPWNAAAEIITRGTRGFLDNAHLIKKVAFPIEIIPSIVAGTAALNFLIALAIYSVVYIAAGFMPTEHVVLLPFAILLQFVFTCGVVMVTSVANVYYRDVENIVGIMMMVLFWVTPIVYQISMVPEKFRIFIYLNPFYYFVSIYQDLLFYHSWPDGWRLVVATFVASATFLLGAYVLSASRRSVPDEL